VTPEEFARLQDDSKAAESFFHPGLGVEDLLAEVKNLPAEMNEEESGVRFLCIGPYWHALHFLLTGDGDLRPHALPPPPLGNVVQEGTETQWSGTYGHVRSLTPDEVCEAAAALGKISVEELLSRFSVALFTSAQIYRLAGRARWTDEDSEPLFEIYPRVVEFFQSAARDGDMILVSAE
jgi:hypothetical protein